MTENINTINMNTDKDDETNDIHTFKFTSSTYRYLSVGIAFLIIVILIIIANYF